MTKKPKSAEKSARYYVNGMRRRVVLLEAGKSTKAGVRKALACRERALARAGAIKDPKKRELRLKQISDALAAIYRLQDRAV